MNPDILPTISANDSGAPLRGTLVEREPLSSHTAWRVGGPADRFYRPADIDDVANLLARLPDIEPVMWLGLGSNLLVRDGGVRGTVILTTNLLGGMERLDEQRIRVDAGVPCAKVAKYCARAGLAGVEFLAGIPGTMGGALAMNAGAYGSETWNWVESVDTLDRRGGRHRRQPREFRIGYRSVKGPPDEWFVGCVLKLGAGDAAALQARIKELLARRGASQPTQLPNCGSVFRNPNGDYAARLIETAGLKNTCIGGACVAEKHANFIVNMGNATAADIEALIQKVEEVVDQIHGIRLVREVRVVGEPLQPTMEAR